MEQKIIGRCPHCDNEIHEGQKFCPNCGVRYYSDRFFHTYDEKGNTYVIHKELENAQIVIESKLKIITVIILFIAIATLINSYLLAAG